MTLLSIRLFLREDEIGKMKIEDFQSDLFTLDDNGFPFVTLFTKGRVNALAVKVQGKCDAAPVTLLIFPDDNNPLFCPVRHLFVYLKVTNIRSGFLFPGSDALKDMIAKGLSHGAHHISYDAYLHRYNLEFIHHILVTGPSFTCLSMQRLVRLVLIRIERQHIFLQFGDC